MANAKSRLAYSTDHPVPKREKPAENRPQTGRAPAEQRVVVRLDRKGRGGKSVTVVEGLLLPQKEKESLLKELKGRLGTGGTVTGAGFEIQGDHRDTVMAGLEERGYRPKRSGG